MAFTCTWCSVPLGSTGLFAVLGVLLGTALSIVLGRVKRVELDAGKSVVGAVKGVELAVKGVELNAGKSGAVKGVERVAGKSVGAVKSVALGAMLGVVLGAVLGTVLGVAIATGAAAV